MKASYFLIVAAAIVAAPVMADDDHHGGRDRFDRFDGGLEFTAVLSGAQEVPGNASEGVGRVVAKFDKALTRVYVDVRIRGLTGSLFASHFHCNRPGANGPVAVGLISPGPLMFDGERITGTLTNADFVSATDCSPVVDRPVNNIAALAFAMRDGLVYLNVHTDFAPSGEIRGQMIEVDDDHRRYR